MAKQKSQPEPRRPKPLIVPTQKEHTHTIILLHDKGDKGREFGRGFLKATALQDRFPTVRFVFPCAFNAPIPASSSGSGDKIQPIAKKRVQTPTQWFDNPPHVRQCASTTASLRETAKFLQRLVHEEAKVLTQTGKCGMHEAHHRIFVAGKGQGGAAALLYLIGSHRRLGGFIGFDAHIPWESQMDMVLAIWAADGCGGDLGALKGVDCVRGLLGFEPLEGKEGKGTDAMRQLETPVCFMYDGLREKGRSVVSLLAGGFRMTVTNRWCAHGGEEWYGSSEDMEAVFGFLEMVGVPRIRHVRECEADAE
ncbi:hypothetical protein BJX65DRAFT_279976 [Aspergillus insuetus]